MSMDIRQREHVAELIAGSPNWQTWCDTDLAGARNRVCWPDYFGQLLPYCVLVLGGATYSKIQSTGTHSSWRGFGDVSALFFDRVSEDHLATVALAQATDDSDLYTSAVKAEDNRFGSAVGGVIEEMIASDRLVVGEMQLNRIIRQGPWFRSQLDSNVENPGAEFDGPYWQVQYDFYWGRE